MEEVYNNTNAEMTDEEMDAAAPEAFEAVEQEAAPEAIDVIEGDFDSEDNADDFDFDDDDEGAEGAVDDTDEDDADDTDDEDGDTDVDDDDDVDSDDGEIGNTTTRSATPEVSDEELDQIADTAIAALDDILKYFDLGEVTIDEYEGDEGELILDITGDDLAVLIGRHGKTLEALQFVISSITTRIMGFRYPVVIDVEGYKGRQRQKLENLAFSSAKRALSQNKSVKMRPMTPYERRIIHVALREFDGVSTASEGEGSSRHVVVIPD